MNKRYLSKFYKIIINLIYFLKWRRLYDEFSTNYTASPKYMGRYIYFNQIDFDLALSCQIINEKSQLFVSKNQSNNAFLLHGYLFLNLTERPNDNLNFIGIIQKLITEYDIKTIIFRYHPQFRDEFIIHKLKKRFKNCFEFSSFLIDSQKEININNFQYIVSAVSSSLSSLNNYKGKIFLSRKASSFLDKKNFDYYCSVLNKHTTGTLIEVN